MDPATLVVEALAVGAGAGLRGTASAAIADSYNAVKHALARRLTGAGRHGALAQLAAIEAGTGAPTDALVGEIVRADAVDDHMVAAARHLLALADPEGTKAGKYQVDLREARGVQVGDGNTQHNTFN